MQIFLFSVLLTTDFDGTVCGCEIKHGLAYSGNDQKIGVSCLSTAASSGLQPRQHVGDCPMWLILGCSSVGHRPELATAEGGKSCCPCRLLNLNPYNILHVCVVCLIPVIPDVSAPSDCWDFSRQERQEFS